MNERLVNLNKILRSGWAHTLALKKMGYTPTEFTSALTPNDLELYREMKAFYKQNRKITQLGDRLPDFLKNIGGVYEN